LTGLRQETKHHGKVYGAATPAGQTGNLVLIPTKQKSFIARKRIAAIMVISGLHEGSRRLSENGFVKRLSEHFVGKAEKTKTPEA